MHEVLNKAMEAYAVPINRAVQISKIFTIIPQTGTCSTHGKPMTVHFNRGTLPSISSRKPVYDHININTSILEI